MTSFDALDGLPEGISSLLDTDLYKLTMQSAVLKFFPQVDVTYTFTNRTPSMKFTRRAYEWLENQIQRLGNITITSNEIQYLRVTCPYLNEAYVHFLETFRLYPAKQVQMSFYPNTDQDQGGEEVGGIELHTKGLWVDTILYEIPLLALTSEAYFKFCDRDWNYDGQLELAREKGLNLIQHGCLVSEFGSRRRRDYHTQDLVVQGLQLAIKEGKRKGYEGKITGTSNVHFAMKHGVPPIGTMAHEWFMGVAAVTENYRTATETALAYWIATFGKGVLAIALTDTFGTPSFLQAFTNSIPTLVIPSAGAASTLFSSSTIPGERSEAALARSISPIQASATQASSSSIASTTSQETFAEVFTGTRQDSGSPLEFIKTMRAFYDGEGIKEKKTIVFSDSLNVERCIEYKDAAEKAGFAASFGVGTFFTNDFAHPSTNQKSSPLNIVIKLSSANGHPAVKISDNIGKNTGDKNLVDEVKRQLGYREREWTGVDEGKRW